MADSRPAARTRDLWDMGGIWELCGQSKLTGMPRTLGFCCSVDDMMPTVFKDCLIFERRKGMEWR